MLAEWINQLQKELDLASPFVEEEKQYLVQISDDVAIRMVDLEPGASFFANLGLLQKEKMEELLCYLMRANLLGQGTGNTVIGLDKENKFLTLSSFFTYEGDYSFFKERLEEFVNYLIYWREEIAKKYQEALAERF